MALGTVKYLNDWRVGSDNLSQHVYHVVYLSSKGPSDCAVDIEIDRQLMAKKLIMWYRTFCFNVGKDKNTGTLEHLSL